MTRVRRYLDLFDAHAGSHITPGKPADDALLELMVRMAFSDGVFADAELELLQGVLPGREVSAIRAWVSEITSKPIDLDSLRGALETEDQRWAALRFAARMAWRDKDFAEEEQALLGELAAGLELPDGALERVIREMAGPPADRLDTVSIQAALDGLGWGAVQLAPGAVASGDLVGIAPEGGTLVTRVGVDRAECMAIYEEGILGRFLEGAAFLPWERIVTTSHGATLESAVRLHTDDGRIWTLVDPRFNGLSLLIDRLFRPVKPDRGEPPVIERITPKRNWKN